VVDRDSADWIGALELDCENSLPAPDGELNTGIGPGPVLAWASDFARLLEEGQLSEALQVGA
jgi:hypothetical protein